MHLKRVWINVVLRVRHSLRAGSMWAYAILGPRFGIPLPLSLFLLLFSIVNRFGEMI